MYRSDYKNWNLHDAELLEIKHNWSIHNVEISLIAYLYNPITNMSCTLLLENVIESHFDHNTPWGDSKYIHEIDVINNMEYFKLSIHMNSGDVLQFNCKDIKLVYKESKSLMDLYNQRLDKSEFESSLIKTCTELFNTKAILDYNVEELRIMIGQELGLEYLVPLAIEEIEANLMVGSLYPGELLKTLMNITSEFWEKNIDLKNRLQETINEQTECINRLVGGNFRS